jgi:hypothetical protein
VTQGTIPLKEQGKSKKEKVKRAFAEIGLSEQNLFVFPIIGMSAVFSYFYLLPFFFFLNRASP